MPVTKANFSRSDIHIRFLDDMCTPLTWLESIITPPLVGDHLLNKFGCLSNSKREESPSSSSNNMTSGCQSQPIIGTLKNKPVVEDMFNYIPINTLQIVTPQVFN
jgi:hypothetical protein